MAIEIICDDCGNKYRVGDDKAGSRVRCKECGAKIDVPDDDLDQETESSRRPTSKKKKKSSDGPPMGVLIGVGAVVAVMIIGVVLMFTLGGKKQDVAQAGNPPNALPNSNPNNLEAARQADIQGANPLPNSGGNVAFPGFNGPGPQVGNNAPPVNALPGTGLPMGNVPMPNAGGTGLPVAQNPPATLPGTRPGSLPGRLPGRAPRNPNAKPTATVPNVGDAGKPGFKGFAAGDDPALDAPPPDNWKVKVDPTKTDYKIDAEKAVNLKVPKGGDLKDIIYPATPSPFVALGNNANEKNVREVWNLATKQKAGSLTNVKIDNFWGVGALSPDGQHFASSVGHQKSGVVVFAMKGGKLLCELDSGADVWGVASVIFTGPDRLLAVNGNGTGKTWKIPSGDIEHDLQLGEAKHAYQVAVSPGGNYLAATTGKNALQVFDLNTAEVVGELAIPQSGPFANATADAMSFSPDGQELAIVTDGRGDDRQFLRYNVADGKLLAKAPMSVPNDRPHADSVKTNRLEWFPDRGKLLWRGHHILDAKLGGPVFNVPEEDGGSEAPRKIVDSKRILIGFGGRQNAGLKTAPIPLGDIEAAAKVVAAGGDASDAGMPTLSKANYDGMIDLAPVATNWTMKPDPSPADNTVKNAIPLPKDRPSVGGIFVSRPSVGRALVWYTDEHLPVMQSGGLIRHNFAPRLPENQRGTCVIEAYDLTKGGKPVVTFPIPYKSTILDGSLDGEHVVVKTTKPNDERLDVYNAMSAKHIAGWRPYQLKEDFFKAATSALVIDGEHCVTQNFSGITYLWKLPECKAVWKLKQASQLSVSPGGKYLGFLAESRYLFMDPRTGELVGELPVTAPMLACAFHPMGTHLAVLASDTVSPRILIVDVATGKATADFYVPQGNSSISWCGDTSVLLDKTWLVDLKQQKNAWTYAMNWGAPAKIQPDGRYWYVASGGGADTSITLSCATLPEKAAADLINSSQLPDESLLKPGMTIDLSVNLQAALPPDRPNLAQEVGMSIEAGLKKNGFQVGAGGPYTLVVTTSQANTGKNMEFRAFGIGGGGNSTVAVVEVKCEVALVSNGQPIWKHTQTVSNATFGIVRLAQGEDVTAHLAKQMWAQVADRLLKMPVPKQIFPTTAGKGLGKSQFVAGGVQPVVGQ